jgi:ubiquinone/menaquinone biosynthesis C-methylase UbiE
MKRFVKKYLPRGFQSFFRRVYYHYPIVRRIYYLPTNIRDALRGKGKKLVPPRSKIFVGDSDFELAGQEFLSYFTDLCGLAPDEKILEIGSGIGRMAIPLTKFLSAEGSYVGIDIVNEGIEWCRKKITPLFPNFTFFNSDIYNYQYNAKGRYRAGEYRFPFADASFDFVFLTSVFTHMLPADVDHYLAEISRVLRPGGRCLITYFLIDDSVREALAKGNHHMKYAYEDCLVIDPRMPEASIAHPEKRIRELYLKYGLAIVEPVRYGNWCGRSEFLSSQDIVIASKSIS